MLFQPGDGLSGQVHWCCAQLEDLPMRTLAFTILTMSIALAAGQARAQTYGPGFYGPWAYESVPNSYCLQGRDYGYPGIANIPATPNAWPPRAVLSPIAGSIPTSRSPASGAATIGSHTERQSRRATRQRVAPALPAAAPGNSPRLITSSASDRCRGARYRYSLQFLKVSTPDFYK